MDLLGNYASSDEDEHEEQPSSSQLIPAAKPAKSESVSAEEKDDDFLPISAPKRGGIFNSLPPPKSSLFNSLPQPKSQSFPNPKPQSGAEHRVDEEITENPKPKSSSSSLFSSIPRPKSSSLAASSASAAKKVVQFRPPMITNPYSRSLDKDDDDDDDDEGEEEKKRKRSREKISTTSATSFLSSIPAPKHSATLGVLPSASGMGRRAMLETSSPASNVSTESDADANPNVEYSNNQSNDANYANYSSTGNDGCSNPDSVNYGGYDHSTSLGGESYAYYADHGGASTDVSSVSTAGVDAGINLNEGSYEGVDYSYPQGNHVEYSNYGNNMQSENNWGNSTALPEASGVIENVLPMFGKRGRKDIPPEIIEVKQDELMKNRPREDQVKSTGIAFGPAYQPASTKGKPTKLHKRKHQIGSLYFDMRQKETELAERRSRGYLTKSQTQGKYGW